ncbi:MAG: polysaccharide biosynthesis protein, partial [Clostridia bacterium]|nr:polysaccharide biosynthesis protein [Clostridia bacterium]
MLQKTKKTLGLVGLMLWDAFSMVASFFLSNLIVFYDGAFRGSGVWYNPITWIYHTFSRDASEYSMYGININHLIAVLAVCVGTNAVFNMIIGNYNSSLKHFGMFEVFKSIASCVALGTAFHIFNVSFVDIYEGNELQFTLTMVAILIILSLAGRSSVRIVNELHARINAAQVQKSGEMVRTLIFGAGEAGAYFCAKHKKDLYTRVQPVIFIDDDPALYHTTVHGVKVYGGSEKLEEAIDKFQIQEVIVAIPTASRQVLKFVVDICRNKNCKIRRFGNVDDVDLSNVKLTNIDLVDLLRRDKVTLNMQAVEDFIKDKTVLVTGGAGSIGSEICRQVLDFGCKHLVVFDIHENGLFEIENELKVKHQGNFSLRLGSIRDTIRLEEVFKEFKPQVVFHAAAHKHVPMMEYSPKEAIKNNVRGTINVAMQSIINKADKFILISTDKAVNPTNIMGASKRIAEQAIQLLNTMSDTDLSAVRFGNVLGSNGSVVPVFRKQIEEGGPVTVTHPDMRRYFMTIPEAVQLVL